MIERGGFAWSASAAVEPMEKQNPWKVLQRASKTDNKSNDSKTPITVPVILDQNTSAL